MRIKKENVARLTSLSALGAGALGVAAGTAQAGIVYYSIVPPPNNVVGPGGASHRNVSASVRVGPPGSSYLTNLAFEGWRTGWSGRTSGYWKVGVWGNVQFRTHGSFLSIVGAGKKWSSLSGALRGSVPIAWRHFSRTTHAVSTTSFPRTYVRGWWVTGTRTSGGGTTGGYFHSGHWTNYGEWNRRTVTSTRSTANGRGPFTDKYALFQFQAGGTTLYGWLELSNSISTHPGSGPNVTLEAWAYDDSGAQIGAGYTGATPEPSTMALTGLAALALGAAGLRRWRAARKPAA